MVFFCLGNFDFCIGCCFWEFFYFVGGCCNINGVEYGGGCYGVVGVEYYVGFCVDDIFCLNILFGIDGVGYKIIFFGWVDVGW